MSRKNTTTVLRTGPTDIGLPPASATASFPSNVAAFMLLPPLSLPSPWNSLGGLLNEAELWCVSAWVAQAGHVEGALSPPQRMADLFVIDGCTTGQKARG